jgi:hypothetical protein
MILWINQQPEYFKLLQSGLKGWFSVKATNNLNILNGSKHIFTFARQSTSEEKNQRNFQFQTNLNRKNKKKVFNFFSRKGLGYSFLLFLLNSRMKTNVESRKKPLIPIVTNWQDGSLCSFFSWLHSIFSSFFNFLFFIFLYVLYCKVCEILLNIS